MPTPVGPLGPNEMDPNDPDLWNWDAEDDSPRRQPRWIRLTAWLIAVVFVFAVVAAFLR